MATLSTLLRTQVAYLNRYAKSLSRVFEVIVERSACRELMLTLAILEDLFVIVASRRNEVTRYNLPCSGFLDVARFCHLSGVGPNKYFKAWCHAEISRYTACGPAGFG